MERAFAHMNKHRYLNKYYIIPLWVFIQNKEKTAIRNNKWWCKRITGQDTTYTLKII